MGQDARLIEQELSKSRHIMIANDPKPSRRQLLSITTHLCT